jgi:hypothetical protein
LAGPSSPRPVERAQLTEAGRPGLFPSWMVSRCRTLGRRDRAGRRPW